MAAAKDQLVCHICGFANEPESERCVSCGARLEELGAAYSSEDDALSRDQQTGFSILWAVVSLDIFLALQAGALLLLPKLIDAYDPQGFSALMISVAMWFAGGLITGAISPGKTFLEPALGGLLAVGPTVWWIVEITPTTPGGGGFQLNMAAYVVGGLIGAMASLGGAFLGEKVQDALGRGRKQG